MKTTFSALTAMAFVCLAQVAQANVIDTAALKLVGIVQTHGEYDNAGLGSWNGAPLSPENQPTPEQDQLALRSHSTWIAPTKTISMSWCQMCLTPTSVSSTAPLSNLSRSPG
jgi:hypothetical protein